jgi:hypothetical protein
MRNFVCAIALVAIVIAGTVSAPATKSASAANGTDTIPDLSGMWGRNSLDFEAPLSGPGPILNLARRPNGGPDINTLVGDYNSPILRPNAAVQLKRLGEISRSGLVFPDPHNSCWPEPVPYILYNFQIQILQEPRLVTILYMEDHEVRRIRLNSKHPVPLIPSWYGDSVGHYEGDTLVVDTVGVKVGPLAYVDEFGTPYSENIHVVERYRLIDREAAIEAIARHDRDHVPVGPGFGGATIDTDYQGKALQIEFTVEDTGVFTIPWTALSTYRRPSSAWEERVCAENTRDHAINQETKVPMADKPDF